MSASASARAGGELAPDLQKQEARGTASERQRCSQWRHKDEFYNQDWQEQGELTWLLGRESRLLRKQVHFKTGDSDWPDPNFPISQSSSRNVDFEPRPSKQAILSCPRFIDNRDCAVSFCMRTLCVGQQQRCTGPETEPPFPKPKTPTAPLNDSSGGQRQVGPAPLSAFRLRA